MANQFQQIVDSINSLMKSGALGPEDGRFLKKALKDVKHSLSVKNIRKAESRINDFSKRLLERVR